MEHPPSGVGRRGERCRSTRAAWHLWTALSLAGLSIGALGGCGGDDDGTSPASLKGQLLPASEIPGFKVVRELEWDNPIDFACRDCPCLRLLRPQTPSKRLRTRVRSGRWRGAGGGKGSPFEGPVADVDVVQLGSDEDARKALDYVRKRGTETAVLRRLRRGIAGVLGRGNSRRERRASHPAA